MYMDQVVRSFGILILRSISKGSNWSGYGDLTVKQLSPYNRAVGIGGGGTGGVPPPIICTNMPHPVLQGIVLGPVLF